MVLNPTTAVALENEFAQLDNNGRHRHGSVAAAGVMGSVSGYFIKKFMPLGVNPYDADWNTFLACPPRLRLADVYLMYGEAVYFGYGSASSSHPGCVYTAQSAIEKIRNRAQLPPLPDRYYSGDQFMETLIRERTVEFAFEGLRFIDLRRWNVAGDLKYRQKTIINFELDASSEPINFQEVVRVTRVFDKKHNWFPFQTEFTNIYEGFQQNPGW